jgi:phage gp29-like protein
LHPRDAEVIAAQQELERLTQAALTASAGAAAAMLAPVRDLVMGAASLTDIRDRLLEVYPEMPAADLEEFIYQARVMAALKGMTPKE